MGKGDEKNNTAAPGLLRKSFRVFFLILWTALAWASVPVLVAGLAVRLSVRDDYDPVAGLFYATPWAVLLLLAIICTIYWWSRPRIRWVALAILVVCLSGWILKNFGFAPVPAQNPA